MSTRRFDTAPLVLSIPLLLMILLLLLYKKPTSQNVMSDPIENQLPPQSLVAPDSPDWWWVWTPDTYRPEGTWTPVKVMGELNKPGTWHASFNNSMLTLSDIAKRMPGSRWVKHVSPALSAPPPPVKKAGR